MYHVSHPDTSPPVPNSTVHRHPGTAARPRPPWIPRPWPQQVQGWRGYPCVITSVCVAQHICQRYQELAPVPHFSTPQRQICKDSVKLYTWNSSTEVLWTVRSDLLTTSCYKSEYKLQEIAQGQHLQKTPDWICLLWSAVVYTRLTARPATISRQK